MSKKPVSTTAYTEKTAKKYVIESAVAYTDIEFDKVSSKFKGNLIGATNGGVTLKIEPTYRDIEVDGVGHVKAKGNTVIENIKATVVVKLKEITAEALKASINGALRDATEDEAPTGYKVIESKRYLSQSDYIGNLGFVGRMSGTDLPIIAILENVITVSTLPMETKDKGEVVIEITYEATATYEQIIADKYPWKLLYPEVI